MVLYFMFFHSLLVRWRITFKFTNHKLDLCLAVVIVWLLAKHVFLKLQDRSFYVLLEEANDDTLTYFMITGKFILKVLWTLM